VARYYGAILAEVLDLLDGHIFTTCQMQRALKRHWNVAIRKEKPVAIWPIGSCWIKLQEL
jgi:hypothetical protein